MARSRAWLPFATLLLATAAPAQSGRDDLSRTFDRWLRDFAAGKLEPGDQRGAIKKPYLTKKLLQQLPLQLGKYDRLREARDLFGLAKKRGTAKDAERLIKVIATSLKKKGGKFWEVTGKFTQFRNVCIDVIGSGKCPPQIQASIIDRIRGGLTQKAAKKGNGGADEPPTVFRHKEPELATALLPILGRIAQPAFKQLFEDCLRVEHSGMQTSSAKALALMGFGPSITAVARALNVAEYPDDVAVLASSISKLVEAKKPPPKERDLKFALNVVLDRFDSLKDWRARISLIQVMRRIRSRGTVPVLIAFLEDIEGKLGKTGKAGRPYSGTLMSSAHEALVELTGFYANQREPQKWRAWWESVKESFVLPPARQKDAAKKDGTVAQGFFGIPVSGNRVVFVFDTSGSMQWPYESTTVVGNKPSDSGYESRLERAKKELNKAVKEMTPDCKFNVVFFSGNTRVWKPKLVWANKKNKKAIAAYLERLNADGGTALYDGMDEAMQIKLEKKRSSPYGAAVDEIFLLSDGSPTLGSITNTDKILDVIRTWNNGAQVRVNTIFIGDEDVDKVYAPPNTIRRLPGNMPPEKFMKRLAEENNGKFVEPNRR